MGKIIFIFLTIVISGVASAKSALSLDDLNQALTLPQTKQEIGDRVVDSVTVSSVNQSTTWTHRIRITVSEAGLGPNGPDQHPCFLDIERVDIGGVVKTDVGQFQVGNLVCAQNSPRIK